MCTINEIYFVKLIYCEYYDFIACVVSFRELMLIKTKGFLLPINCKVINIKSDLLIMIQN